MNRPSLASHFNFQVLGFVAVTAVLTAAIVSVTQRHASAEIAEKVAVQQRPSKVAVQHRLSKVAVQQRPSVHVIAKVSVLAYY